MDLDLAPVRTSGRAASRVQCEVVRELNAADIALLATEPRGVQTPSIKRIRDSHHAIARLIAEGLANSEIGAMTGYSQSRISILKSDPSFAELVEFYRSQTTEGTIDALQEFHAKAAAVRNAATEVLLDRLEDTPETFQHADLLDVTKTYADRTGHGPASRSTAVNINMSYADALAARRRRDSGSGAATTPQPSGEPASAVQLAPPSSEGKIVDV